MTEISANEHAAQIPARQQPQETLKDRAVKLDGLVHVDRDGKPLCKQVGDGLQLRSDSDFWKLATHQRCQQCERSLGGDEYGRLMSLGPQQQAYLREMSGWTMNTRSDGWYPVASLCQKKTSADRTSVHRSIRALLQIGLVEKRTDEHHRALVRLTEKARSFPKRFLFGRSKTKP
jgi:hypothetical protein